MIRLQNIHLIGVIFIYNNRQKMDQYKLEYEKGSGTFSVVFTAMALKTNKHVAIKCMKKKFDSLEKVKKLKEIQALNILSSHENIIKLIEALYDEPSGSNLLMQENLHQCSNLWI